MNQFQRIDSLIIKIIKLINLNDEKRIEMMKEAYFVYNLSVVIL